MAESKGCAKALRRVTRGGADSTSSPGLSEWNMRDWVATVESDFTWVERANEVLNTKLEKRTSKFRPALQVGRMGIRASNFESYCVVRRLLLGGCGFRGGIGVLLGETLDAASGVDEFLLAGEKWVAVGADFDVQTFALDCGAGLEVVAAGAVDGNGMIVRMNTGLHDSPIVRGRSARLGSGSSLQQRR
jgi:hypothetical protein